MAGQVRSARDIDDSAVIEHLKLGTMREGSLVRERFEKIRPGMTVAEAVQAGVSKFDLVCAINRGRVALRGTNLRGAFVLINETLIREKANRKADPRHIFYKAMLETRTYEAYDAAVGGVQVSVETNKTGPISGRMEIKYARKRGWIADANKITGEVLPADIEGTSIRQADRRYFDKESSDAHFPLEHHLRDFLVSNLGLVDIDGKRLSLYQDECGRGIEYQTTVGSIDILAVDNEGALYVFELKRGDSSDRTIGQLARYMGWVKQTIGKGRSVYGVIVARAITDKLKFAREAVPNVYLLEYGISLTLRQAHEPNLRSY